MDGDESQAFPAKRDRVEDCGNWTATRTQGSFDAALEYFSVRLGVARTTCQYAEVDYLKQTAKVVFRCCKVPARLLTITTDAPVDLFYARNVPADRDYDPRSIDCTESGPLPGRPVHSVAFTPAMLPPNARIPLLPTPPLERVRVQFSDIRFPGLIVNDLTFTRYLTSTTGGTVSQAQILDAFQAQWNAGLTASPDPRVRQYDVVRNLLNDLALKTATVTLSEAK
jgi:hypothetical protein